MMRKQWMALPIGLMLGACAQMPAQKAETPVVPAQPSIANNPASLVSWGDIDPEVIALPEYKALKDEVTTVWELFAARKWDELYTRETPSLRQAMTLDYYRAMWGNAAVTRKITVLDVQKITDEKFKVTTQVKYTVPSWLPAQYPDTMALSYEWHFIEEEKSWRRDYRDPVFRK